MKVIPLNLITAVVASSENSNYPADNVIDQYPGFIWKGLSDSETLTFTLNGLSSAFALFNTNATSISASITDPNFVEWETGVLSSGDDGIAWEAGVAWSAFIVPTEELVSLDDDSGAFMFKWDEVNAELDVILTLTNSDGQILYAGCAVAGKLMEFNGPHEMVTEGTKDLSYVDEYNGGEVFVKDRDVLRSFDMKHVIPRNSSFNDFIFSVKKIIKKRPAAWLITDEDNARWLVYARFITDPVGKHSVEIPGYTELTYQLLEVR